MHEDADIWPLEQSLWLGGAETYETALAPECVMIFPEPTGVLDRASVIAALMGAPRWRSVEMTGRRVSRPNPTTVILVYRAEAVRDAGPAYAALCSSAYVRREGAWRIVMHQQTPIG